MEWLQATATGILALLIASWLLLATGARWRRWVWARAGTSIVAVGEAFHGQVRPLWLGWRVTGPELTVEYFGGLWGLRTRVRVSTERGAYEEHKAGASSLADVRGAFLRAQQRPE